MRTRRWLVSLLVAMLALTLVGGASAQGASPEDPAWIWTGSPASGSLTGRGGGGFAYYAIEYPGHNKEVTIHVSFFPGDKATLLAVGLNVYGPDGELLGHGEVAGDAKEVRASATQPATWLIQVYNYGEGLTVGYTVSVQGLPTRPAAAVATPSPDALDEEAFLPLDAAGTLVGSHGGAYAFHEVAYESGQHLGLVLHYGPDDPTIRQGVGMVVYGPDGWQRQARIYDGERAVFIDGAPTGTYLVQVYNYIEGLEINYRLTQ